MGTKYMTIDKGDSVPECSIAFFFHHVASVNERDAVVLEILVVL